jgi:hypothetical protein
MTYDWERDSIECWKLAIRLIAIQRGFRRPATPAEMYLAEAKGSIP